MARVSHRLDLVCVPQDRSRVPDPAAFAQAMAQVDGAFATLVEGGAGTVRLDLPQGRAIYGNIAGGFRVFCPADGGAIAKPFAGAVERWKAGGPFMLSGCPSCGGDHALDAIDCRPVVAFGRGAVVFADIGGADLLPAGRAWAEALLGPVHVVLRRP